MVIDTSALVAILLGEADAVALARAIASSPFRRLPAPSLVELAAVMLARSGPQSIVAVDALLQRLAITVEPMSAEAAGAARTGYARFGRGIGNPGVLNFGDALAYGVATSLGEPLLFVGNDFAATDVTAARY